MTIQNRFEFLFYLQTVNANPNGDPDMGNLPRMDPQDNHGYITDGAMKRRIRNYIQQAFAGQKGMNIFVRSQSNLNTAIARAKELAGVPVMSKEKADVNKGRAQACAMYHDVRAFGAVMSTGPNAGQVRGPVQLTFARSLDPIEALDISITRMATRDNAGGAQTVAEFEKWEGSTAEDKLRTMGRKQFVPYGLYEARGFISANLAQDTGFDEADLKALFEAIMNMYEHDRSSSKGIVLYFDLFPRTTDHTDLHFSCFMPEPPLFHFPFSEHHQGSLIISPLKNQCAHSGRHRSKDDAIQPNPFHASIIRLLFKVEFERI